MAATATLDAAGVPSPGVDAEELAGHLLGVSRTRLGLTPLVESTWVDGYQALVAQRARADPAAAPDRLRAVRPRPVDGRPGRVHPAAGDRVAGGLGASRPSPTSGPRSWSTCAPAAARSRSPSRRPGRTRGSSRSSGRPPRWPWPGGTSSRTSTRGGTRVELRGGDVLDERLLVDLDGIVDLVTANPPYVPDGTAVEPEVADHDPPEAVFGGPDGLAVIRPLISVAAGLLKVGGVLAIEHDDTQGESVPALLRARRVLDDVAEHADLTGRPRFVTATRVRLPDRPVAPVEPDDVPAGRRLRGKKSSQRRAKDNQARDDLRLCRPGGPAGRAGGRRARGEIGQPGGDADRHGVRHRRRRVQRRRRSRAAGGQGPRTGHAGAGAGRLLVDDRRAGDGGAAGRPHPDRGVLARRPVPGGRARAVVELGSRATPGAR